MSKMLFFDELKGELREMLIRFMIDCNEYDTDVYLYIDEDAQIGRLDEFVNVGGNSWLDDDHITIYTDKQHYESFYDLINNIDELAEALNMSCEELRTDVMRWLDKIGEWYEDSDIEDIELEDAIRYVDQHDTLVTNFCNWREEYIRDYYCDDLDDVIDEIVTKYDYLVEDINILGERGY